MEVLYIMEHVSVCCNLRHKDLYDVITKTFLWNGARWGCLWRFGIIIIWYLSMFFFVCSALNSSDIKVLGVDLLPGYYDPFSGRTLTKGEVGCFLSHFFIWKEVRRHTRTNTHTLYMTVFIGMALICIALLHYRFDVIFPPLPLKHPESATNSNLVPKGNSYYNTSLQGTTCT